MSEERTELTTVDRQLPYVVMDEEDTAAIIDELHGGKADAYVYEFNQGGKLTTGLSIVGVRETARLLNERGKTAITVQREGMQAAAEGNEYVVMVYAFDHLRNMGWWGTASEARTEKSGEARKFARQIAFSKAQRNAIRGLLPEDLVAQFTTEFSKANLKRLERQTRQVEVTHREIEQPKAPATRTRKDVIAEVKARHEKADTSRPAPSEAAYTQLVGKLADVAGDDWGQVFGALGWNTTDVTGRQFVALYQLATSATAEQDIKLLAGVK